MRGERGSGTIEFAWYAGLSLLLLLMLSNLVVWRIAQGAVHSAVDQGARAGARYQTASVPACEARIAAVLSGVLAGPAGEGASYVCADDGETVTARVDFTLRAWLPPLVDHAKASTGQARKERMP